MSICGQYILAFLSRITVLLPLCFIHVFSFSQNYSSKIVFKDKQETLTLSKGLTADSSIVTKYIEKKISQLKSEGFLDVRIDSISFFDEYAIAYGTKGELYQWVFVNASSSANPFSSNPRNEILDSHKKPIHVEELHRRINSSLSFLENNGFPFAKIVFENTEISDNQVNVGISVREGPKIIFDTLYIKGELKVSNRFLQSYLGCKQGNSYSEKNVKNIDKRLALLPFASVIRPSQVEFIPGKARVYTYLNKRKANRFSGILGFGPQPNSNSGVMFTGNLNMKLLNSLKNAETFSLQWNAPGNSSQKLMVYADWPYILGTNMAFDASFAMVKRDTSYLTVNPFVSVGFYSHSNAKFSLNFDHKTSIKIAEVSDLSISNFTSNLFGFSYKFNNLSGHTVQPKGLMFNATIAAGQRKILLGGTDNRSAFVEVEALASVAYSIFRNFVVIKNGIQLAAKGVAGKNDSYQKLFDNELYRMGGSNLLRGFDEESILTNQYLLNENEIHFLLGQTFSLFSFIDIAGATLIQPYETRNELLLGTGFGFSLHTRSGNLSISYALGKGAGQTITLKDARIHIEYDSFF